MQNVVQTSIKIATEVKECADRQKKAILICLHLRPRENAVSMLGVLLTR